MIAVYELFIISLVLIIISLVFWNSVRIHITKKSVSKKCKKRKKRRRRKKEKN